MSGAQRHLAGLLIVLAVLAAAGCVSVPTSGPIEKVEGPQRGWQNPVNVEVRPPGSGDTPREIVEGYLLATSNYQPNYSVARQFLTRAAAETWSPEAGVWVYRGETVAERGNTVTLNGWLVGTLDADRTYTADDTSLKIDFSLSKESGGWRINNPPKKLMVEEYSFKSFYRSYDRYFIGDGRSLVPDPIYLPALSNPANVASALMKALLDGPSAWLKPAVSNAVPPNTSLSVDSVTITNGIAEVPLSDSVLQLTDEQRSLLAAQIVYTLRQVGGLKGVLIKVNQQPYRVPGSDPQSQVISVDAIGQDMDPIPFVAGGQPYAVQGGKVRRVTGTPDSPTMENLAGPLGNGQYPVDALAVSVNDNDFAVTTNGRTKLHRAPIASGEEPAPLLIGKRQLLRPQFTRYGEIWEIGQEDGNQRMWRFANDKKRLEVDLAALKEGKVTAFKISPDGTRMALVRQIDARRSELGVARIIRTDKVIVDHWRSLDTTQSTIPLSIGRIHDVAWLDPTELLVLGAGAADTAYRPFRVVQDASQITEEGNPENWNGLELAVSPRGQTAVIIDDQGNTWRDDGSQWSPFIKEKVSTIAYPG